MHRCFELASLGAGYVAPNPMVGAVLVSEDRIIGEGYHKEFGQPHAEVNCIKSVGEHDEHLISTSTLYVSLEPCAHFGKTPPCADLIISHKIQRVVIGCVDPFSEVYGRGIAKLKEAGVEVIVNVLQFYSEELNKRFFTFHEKQRPYIILKWAQSANQKIAGNQNERVFISSDYSNRLLHKWRSEEAAIMVGTNTAIADNPSLNVRLWNGKNPVRLVIDLNLRLPVTLNIFDRQQPTVIFNALKDSAEANLIYLKIESGEHFLNHVLSACHKLDIQSILIEGGGLLLQSFIAAGLWDEARVIQNNELIIQEGLSAPQLLNQQLLFREQISTDTIFNYKKSSL